jgi:hypothetical protein
MSVNHNLYSSRSHPAVIPWSNFCADEADRLISRNSAAACARGAGRRSINRESEIFPGILSSSDDLGGGAEPEICRLEEHLDLAVQLLVDILPAMKIDELRRAVQEYPFTWG